MKPAIIQFKTFHAGQREFAGAIAAGGRRFIGRCGRRWGKTTVLEELAKEWAARGEKVGWFAPEYKFLTPTFGRLVKDLYPLIESKNKTEMLITLEQTAGGRDDNGSIEMWTLDNPDAGRGRDYDKVIIDEAGLKKKGLREVIQEAIEPTLLDRDGIIIMTGTPKGIDDENYFYVACTNKALGWQEFHYPTHSNPNLSQEAVARLEVEKPPLVYQQEHLAEFVDWSGTAFFGLDKLLVDGRPVPFPEHIECVMAVIDTAVKAGREHDGTAVTYFGVSRLEEKKAPLTVLDYDKVQIEGHLLETWLPQVYTRLEELSRITKARYGSLGTFIEDKASGTILIGQAARHGWKVTAIDSVLTSLGKDERAINVSGYVWRGLIKISAFAYDKIITFKGISRNHFLTEILGFRVGVKDQEDDLLDTFTYGIALTLGNSEGF